MTGCSQSIWDITAPELKEAWRQGAEELFYPNGRTQVQSLVGQPAHPHAVERGTFGQAHQNVQIRRAAMVQTHQPGQTAFRSVWPEDIEEDIE
jgi:hypothetical protein